MISEEEKATIGAFLTMKTATHKEWRRTEEDTGPKAAEEKWYLFEPMLREVESLQKEVLKDLSSKKGLQKKHETSFNSVSENFAKAWSSTWTDPGDRRCSSPCGS